MAAEQISDGLKKELVKPGGENRPQVGDTITVHCTGSVAGNPPKKFWRSAKIQLVPSSARRWSDKISF